MQYINFTTKFEDVFQKENVKATVANIQGMRGEPIPGYWYSFPANAPENGEWWRSMCGHVVDADMHLCPVCGEIKPGGKGPRPA